MNKAAMLAWHNEEHLGKFHGSKHCTNAALDMREPNPGHELWTSYEEWDTLRHSCIWIDYVISQIVAAVRIMYTP